MADPNVANVVVDGVERWGAADAKWAQKAAGAPEQPTAPAPLEPVAKEADAPEDAAPGKDPKPTRSRT